MHNVTKIGFDLRWSKPVYVGTNDELDGTLLGPGDAIRWMQRNFRYKHGLLYWRAHSLCYEALTGTLHHDFARQPFVDAWVEQSLHDPI